MATQKRILYIDYMKVFAMILVVMGYVNFANEPVKAWVIPFTCLPFSSVQVCY